MLTHTRKPGRLWIEKREAFPLKAKAGNPRGKPQSEKDSTMKLNAIGSNRTELTIGDYTVLFSYDTPVAYHLTGVGYFKTDKC